MARLGKKLGEGGEGTVYAIYGQPSIAAKIWNDKVSADPEVSLKIELMIENPVASGSVAWPKQFRHNRAGKPVGFTMPRVNGDEYYDLFKWMNPAARRINQLECGSKELLTMTANLTRAIGAIHNAGHVVGDINEKNVMANAKGQVILVDCDSMQIRDPKTGKDFLCKKGRPEYTPPELQDARFDHRLRTKDYDSFGLAVLAHKLLLRGLHPYQSIAAAGETQAEKIQERRFPFNETVRQEGRFTPSRNHLEAWRDTPYRIRELFHRAFDPDWTDKYPRPKPEEWAAAIAEELGLSRDSFQPGPWAPTPTGPAPRCPLCKGEMEAKPSSRNTKGYYWGCRKYPECRGTVDPDDLEAPDCPNCGIKMRRRKALKGANAGNTFWGCRRYPECRGKIDISGGEYPGAGNEPTPTQAVPSARRVSRTSSASWSSNESVIIPKAAKALGLSYNQIYDRVKSGQIPATKVANRYLIKKSDLKAWAKKVNLGPRVPKSW